jgi:hypothetical protein
MQQLAPAESIAVMIAFSASLPNMGKRNHGVSLSGT